MLQLTIMIVGGFLLGTGRFDGQPYKGWKERSVSGLRVGLVSALFVGMLIVLISQLPIVGCDAFSQEFNCSVERMMAFVASVIFGALYARRRREEPAVAVWQQEQTTTAKKVNEGQANTEKGRSEKTVAEILAAVLELEDKSQSFKQEFAITDSYRLIQVQSNCGSALRSLNSGRPREAQETLDLAIRIYTEEVAKARAVVENKRQFNEAIERLTPEEQARVSEIQGRKPY